MSKIALMTFFLTVVGPALASSKAKICRHAFNAYQISYSRVLDKNESFNSIVKEMEDEFRQIDLNELKVRELRDNLSAINSAESLEKKQQLLTSLRYGLEMLETKCVFQMEVVNRALESLLALLSSNYDESDLYQTIANTSLRPLEVAVEDDLPSFIGGTIIQDQINRIVDLLPSDLENRGGVALLMNLVGC